MGYPFNIGRVADPIICDLEALLNRAFPNDLLNTKIENFGADH